MILEEEAGVAMASGTSGSTSVRSFTRMDRGNDFVSVKVVKGSDDMMSDLVAS